MNRSEERKAERQANKIAAQRRAQVDEARQAAFRDVPKIELSPVTDIDVEGELVDIHMAYDDRLIVSSSSSDAETFAGRDQVSTNAPSFPHSISRGPYDLRLTVFDTTGFAHSSMKLAGVEVAHPFVQLMPDGSAVVVGARARFSEGEGERNATVFAPTGVAVESFCVGDGIGSVQVDESGRIWIGYFDEGVFGNFGWGVTGAPEPLGASGLVCWSSQGERLYRYSAPEGFDQIVDCYALNVTGRKAWLCYDDNFPVARVGEEFDATAWTCGTRGVDGLVVGCNRVGLVGGYDGLFDRVIVADIIEDSVEETGTYQLAMPGGDELPDTARVLVRGEFINAVVDGQWLRLRIDEMGE